jgi:hypothetical protein
MADPEAQEPKPETLKLFRRKHSPVVIALSILAVVLAIAAAVYTIYQASQPPELFQHGLRPFPSPSDVDPAARPECLAAQALGVQGQGAGPAAPGRDPEGAFPWTFRPALPTAAALTATSIFEKYRAFRESLSTP